MDTIQLLIYACLAISLVSILIRAVRYARAPIHVRWELYPVPHERGRAHYGGSIFEELDWWKKKRDPDLFNELKEMLQEILLLKGVFHHNRKLWIFSFPFHFGLYLMIGWFLVLIIAAIPEAAGAGTTTGFFSFLNLVLVPLGYLGLALTFIGALGLLLRRILDPDIRKYSVPAEHFNLLSLLAATGLTLAVHSTSDPSFTSLTEYMGGLISFSQPVPIAAGMKAELALASLLIAYIPLSRMGHFIAKYFLYHDVRWSDEPNLPGSKIEANVMTMLGKPVHWSAPHIQTGNTWAEVATQVDGQEEEKK